MRGHHWAVARRAAGVPDAKVCPSCGRTFTRAEKPRQRLQWWIAAVYCSNACAGLARGSAQRGQVRKEDATPGAGRKRARAVYPGPHVCDVCGEPAEIHHRDGDTLNNVRENIAFLCRRHHIRAEDRMAYSRKPMTPERLEHKRALARERARRYRERKRKEWSG